MAKGGFPGMGGMNMNNLMKQAQKMQQQMEKMQAELEEKEFTSTAGGGVVKVTVNGKKQIVDIEIDPEAVDPDDVEMLQDLILSACNQALQTADVETASEMKKLTGGLNLPGMF
ncbi:YbaB/EbfC family nucleoid-associated protein [Clostridium ganghwense]|uniref:Nucleoid-associated protein OXH55_18970 n=1 Tax=Clostridium ganghwense TaxID=312089 RepID=A0ABT4CUV6_9CLOT|nr:YbaB/EbfC family nucleoid-associated protein [Clostridium ganghwense]MCY6372693.1 YbaB/EbfC family nucleoid-associated protein [Clostridium ganghwense]